MRQMISFIQKQTVLVIAGILACVSCFIVPPSSDYWSYLDGRVLALLFCFMIVVAGWEKTGLFSYLGECLTQRVNSMRGLMAALVLLCFFSSMLITNDVALITFVPFSITVLKLANQGKRILKVLVLETAAANLGSMLTPIGNPQNLYLFSMSGMSAGQFVVGMLPLTLLSLLMLLICIVLQKKKYFKQMQTFISRDWITKERYCYMPFYLQYAYAMSFIS